MNHSYDTKLAKRFGALETVILKHIAFWVLMNKFRKSKKHFKEGRYWTYLSLNDFHDKFDYLSRQNIRTILKHLVDDGAIIKDSFNEKNYDKTTWYSISDEVEQLFFSKVLEYYKKRKK